MSDRGATPEAMGDMERPHGFEGWWEDRSLPEKVAAGIGLGILGWGWPSWWVYR